ncbi:divalent metal cation transporter [Amycolatopsis sp. FDAARGOS 1241]|uniref:divalent metal cation transporter n=1 Tax=Amycolatopsis sp. FDAARGOS 1241 TaxID=2778070 RepID=UPI001EF2FD5C|nr:divalent metal cation transporter [Amycolatopsis sp. FDAARGOS 1241]
MPSLPGGSNGMAALMLLVIGIVGTIVASWQPFFWQSYVIGKWITPRFLRYEKADLWIGIVIVVVGATAITGFSAAAFAGTKDFGNFTDSTGLAKGLAAYAGKTVGALFAVALLDASIIGAFALSLSSPYALGDVLGLKHSLHRGIKRAEGFCAVYAGLIALAATIVLIPGSPLGLVTEGVQTLARLLLPRRRCSCCCSATTGRCRAPGQRPCHHRVHLGGGGRPGHPVDRADRRGALPRRRRGADRADRRRLRGGRRGGGRLRAAGPA